VRAIIQRVRRAWVDIEGRRIAEIGRGLLILLGIRRGDDERKAVRLAERCANLRIFEDSKGRMNHSLREIGGEVLVVSQFTLVADTKKGNRPSFTTAEEPERANDLYHRFVERLRGFDLNPQTGRFGARMVVGIENEGPVTIILEV